MVVKLLGGRLQKKINRHERLRPGAVCGQVSHMILRHVDCEVKVVQNTVVVDGITISAIAGDPQVLETYVPMKKFRCAIYLLVTFMVTMM